MEESKLEKKLDSEEPRRRKNYKGRKEKQGPFHGPHLVLVPVPPFPLSGRVRLRQADYLFQLPLARPPRLLPVVREQVGVLEPEDG